MTPDDPRHGTNAGYATHRREGSDPCSPCRVASADYQRQRFYDMHLGRPRLVDVTGSRRRIRALQCIGWPTRVLAAELGYTYKDGALRTLLYDAEFITRSRAKKIDDLYERLCMTSGPSNITRIRATKAGYAPPMAWDNIDDPTERPRGTRRPSNIRPTLDDIDPVAVERAVSGDRIDLTKAERFEVVARLRSMGLSLRQIEDRTGITKAERYIARGDAA